MVLTDRSIGILNPPSLQFPPPQVLACTESGGTDMGKGPRRTRGTINVCYAKGKQTFYEAPWDANREDDGSIR